MVGGTVENLEAKYHTLLMSAVSPTTTGASSFQLED